MESGDKGISVSPKKKLKPTSSNTEMSDQKHDRSTTLKYESKESGNVNTASTHAYMNGGFAAPSRANRRVEKGNLTGCMTSTINTETNNPQPSTDEVNNQSNNLLSIQEEEVSSSENSVVPHVTPSYTEDDPDSLTNDESDVLNLTLEASPQNEA